MCACTGVDVNRVSVNVHWVVLSDSLQVLAASQYLLARFTWDVLHLRERASAVSGLTVGERHENRTPHGEKRECVGEGERESKLNAKRQEGRAQMSR